MKSHVSMEQKICFVCGKEYDSGAILLDKRLKETLETKTTTGYGMCKKDEDLKNKGYIALVGVDESKSIVGTNTIKSENAHRTGRIAHIKEEVFIKIFNVKVPEGKVLFCEDEVVSTLEKMQK